MTSTLTSDLDYSDDLFAREDEYHYFVKLCTGLYKQVTSITYQEPAKALKPQNPVAITPQDLVLQRA